jgi:syntaxin 1A/syntaxin 1B/2/3
MDHLNQLMGKLDMINGSILNSVDRRETKNLQHEKINLISDINKQCQYIKINLPKYSQKEFNKLLMKYLTQQKQFHDTETNIHATQLMMKYPNLTREEAIYKLQHEDVDTEHLLCIIDPSMLLNSNECLNYVTQRHKEIVKLEESINELQELFISTYAIVENQGETINRIETKTNNAKYYISNGKKELKLSLKFF